uniref:Ubiquitin-like domain-containing protein n=1 Tax=Syphacia muris TaxID=451379 RepID=A0A0N5AAU5_9BILA
MSWYPEKTLFFTKGLLTPLGIVIQPWMAAAAMAMSSVSVLTSKPTKKSLSCLEYRNYEAKIMMGNFSVKVHRGVDMANANHTTSKLSVASIMSNISNLFGSQQSVNRIRSNDRIRLLRDKSSEFDYQDTALIL